MTKKETFNNATFELLAQNILNLDTSMQGLAVKAVNKVVTLRNWIIGGYIVEYEQHGSDRALYGDGLLKSLESRISQKGLNVTLFQASRLFYRTYPQIHTLIPKIYSTLSNKSLVTEICATVSNNLLPLEDEQKTNFLPAGFVTSAETIVSTLSFSHIRELLAIEDPLVRFFYETECIKGSWSVRELRRQISTNLHIRIGLSADKMKAM